MRPLGRRPVGGPDTRDTILAAARDLFADQGFDRTTMRAVAARAGVDPALIHHYFGTKDQLLAAALALPFDPAAVLASVGADPEHAGEDLVRRILEVWERDEATRTQLIGLLRTGMSHDHAAEVLRDMLSSTILTVLQRIAAADQPALRAALVGTQMAGLLIGRYLVQIPAVADASVDQLVTAIGPSVQRYLTGSL